MNRVTEILKQHVYCTIILALLLFLVLFLSLSIGDDRMGEKTKDKIMTREKIAEYRQNLHTILNTDNEKQRYKDLEQLAKEVGAGYVNTKIVCSDTRKEGTATITNIRQNPISESELVLNINNALQTETMINMCNIAAGNFKAAMTSARTSFVSALVAMVSALAAWTAIVKK